MLRLTDAQSGMTLDKGLRDYFVTWERFANTVALDGLFRQAVPTAVAYKVTDRTEFMQILGDVIDQAEQVHVGTVDNRKIAAAVMKESFRGHIPILKLMERRPGSDDPTGLDHVDFYYDGPPVPLQAFTAAGGTAEKQENRSHEWVSVRFGDHGIYEAKLVDHTVLAIGARDLQAVEAAILNPAE